MIDPRRTLGSFDRWMWTDLLGFDNRAADFGVGDFLNRAGFFPEVVSLLIADPQFIHGHDGNRDQQFAPTFCSYFAHQANELHARQDWTSFQLRGLVKALQHAGIKVFVSNFDTHFQPGRGNWLDRHPEVLHVSKTHGRMNSLCPWKRLADGTYYEDFFCFKLCEILDDYGFDGYHGADGFAHPRIPIYDGDFSDDMAEQFARHAGLIDRPELAAGADADAATVNRRATWILEHHRSAWIEFYGARQLCFWKKVVDAAHARGRQVVLNSAWTRDPFEAIYRYGVDYRKLAGIGVDGLVVEAAAAALETLEKGEPTSRYLCNFMAALLLIKAYAPSLPLRWLNGVKDNLEQWSALRHTPTVLEAEIHSLTNLYLQDSRGTLHRCADGVVVCLGDGLARHEWQWLNDKWHLAASTHHPHAVLGATLIWSDEALRNEIQAYIDEPHAGRWSTHRLLHHLMSRGSSIASAARVEDLSAMRGPILVIHPRFFTSAQRQKIAEYDAGAVLTIGEEADSTFLLPHAQPLESSDEPFSWVNELPFGAMETQWLDRCAARINAACHRLRVLNHTDAIRLTAIQTSARQVRLLIRNDDFIYLTAEIEIGQSVGRVNVLSGFVTTAIEPRGSRFSVKVPLRGMAVVDVAFQEAMIRPTDEKQCNETSRGGAYLQTEGEEYVSQSYGQKEVQFT